MKINKKEFKNIQSKFQLLIENRENAFPEKYLTLDQKIWISIFQETVEKIKQIGK